jgi:hypothetical protein
VNGLLDRHAELLRSSGISEEVTQARGYWSATAPQELERLFGGTQRKLVPALVIPTLDVRGEMRFCQLRPDSPRVVKGRTCKYELPWRANMVLDVPPAARDALGDPKVPLVVTEGARKADSAVSAGLCAIDLVGVWTWRGRNGHDGLTVLSDWEYIALNAREVFLAFDSDAMTKREVHSALERLWRLLSDRGARVRVVYLPSGEFGTKTGLDDYLAADHDRDDVLGLAVDELRPLPGQGTQSVPRAAQDAALRPTADLLREVRDVLGRYLVLPSAAARLAVALYVLHTWAFDAAHCTPYLVVQSAVMRSGKTRLEEVLELLLRAPWRIAAASESAMFRKIDMQRPTLLLDEVDALFGARAEGTEPIRAILNAGNRPGAAVARMVGEGANMQPADFSVYCPKVLAGIITSRWPSTVLDRAIVIRLQRMKPGESVERLRYRKLREATERLRAQLDRWAQEHVEALREAEPKLPTGLDDRAAESWEALLAIAELAERESGEPWAQHARRAALALAGTGVEEEGHGVLALVAIRAIFGSREALHSVTIAQTLNADEELPFGEYRKGAGLNERGLATLLRPFTIRPHPVQIEGKQARGYHTNQFTDAWARYCPADTAAEGRASEVAHPPRASGASTRQEPSNHGRFGVDGWVPRDPSQNTIRQPGNADEHWKPDGLTDGNAQPGDEPLSHVLQERREPECAYPQHCSTDWAREGFASWVCGVCHPPPDGTEGIVWRYGEKEAT